MPQRNAVAQPPFKIVTLGASAGGLAALEQFFRALPHNPGMAFVVVQHLSPDFKSVMGELLARFTPLPSERVEQGMTVAPNRIFLIPPGKDMTLAGGRFKLRARDVDVPLHLPIDLFLHSLAEDAGNRAVAIILSGTGGDGSRGIVRVRQAGGTVFVQSPESAGFDGMPKAAIATRAADFIGPPAALARRLMGGDDTFEEPGDDAQSADAPESTGALAQGLDLPGEARHLAPIFAHLGAASGLDFSQYKLATVARRIERRMHLRRTDTLEAYHRLLREDPVESGDLLRDLLIGVTQFFRDPEAFAALSETVLPQLLLDRPPEDELRVWVPGCATGEEAYSLAILIDEAATALGIAPKTRVFATDVHRGALKIASQGVYSAESLAEVSAERRDRYFEETPEGWRANAALRRAVVFAAHNVITDAPFTRIDLVSCRNLLIYFLPEAQARALRTFHFALRLGGCLFQGPSESIATLEGEFSTVNRHWNIHIKVAESRDRLLAGLHPGSRPPSTAAALPRAPRGPARDRKERLYLGLLERFAPQGFLVSRQRELLHTFGEAGRFLSPRGPATSDLLALLTGDLRTAVSAALQRAISGRGSTTFERVRIDVAPGQYHRVNVEVVENAGIGDTLYFVRVEPVETRGSEAPPTEDMVLDEAARDRVLDLERELEEAREHLQTTVEELDTINEELQATNEELLASNEEMQSTNEELQSVNEELHTVNAEYERKNEELNELNRDLVNLMNCTEIGTVFVDTEMRIRKFTPAVQASFRLRAQDIGRPLDEMASMLRGQEDLLDEVRRVMRTGEVAEREVVNADGRDLLQRIHPYRDEFGEIQGAALSFVDLAHVKRLEAAKEAAERFRTAVLNSLAANIAVVDHDGVIIAVNEGWKNFARDNDAQSMVSMDVGASYYDACHCGANEAEYTDAQRAASGIRGVLSGSMPAFELEYPCDAPDESRWFLMRVTPLDMAEGGAVIVHINITGLKTMQETIAAQERKFRRLFQNMPVGLARCSPVGDLLDYNDRLPAITGHGDAAEFARAFNPLRLENSKGLRLGDALRASGSVAQFECAYTRPEGEMVHLSVSGASALDLEPGAPPVFDISVTDITALKESEARLMAAEREANQLAAAVRAAAESIIITDVEGLIEYVNPAFESMTGYGAREAVGRDPRMLSSGEHDSAYFAALWETILRGETWTGHIVNQRKDGTRFTAQATISPVRDGAGQIAQFVAVMRDVTHEEMLERQVRQGQKLEAIGTLAGGIAHDFNNILAAIQGYGELARNSVPDDSDVCRDLDQVLLAAHRAADLVRQILTFSRRSDEERHPVEFGLIAKEALNLLRASLPANILFEIDIARDAGMVMADPTHLHQLVMNLCTNAHHAMRATGGTLKVVLDRVDLDGDAALEIGLAPGPHLRLLVEDTGVGMPPMVLERIFEPFYTTKGSEGTGMGLSIVHGIVHSFEGAISVESTVGKGTRFAVHLPVAGTAPTGKTTQSADVPPGRGEHILVVDDESAIVTLMGRALERYGYTVSGHTSVEDALAAFEADPAGFDAVITDQTMPAMLGVDLGLALWKLRKDLPVILTSGYSDSVNPDDATALGFAAYFAKPVHLPSLAKTLREVLDARAAPDS